MASPLQCFLLFFSFSFSFVYLVVISHAHISYTVLPVTKDVSTLQYRTKIFHGTPLAPINLVVDLSGPFLWVDSASGCVSPSHRLIHCCSSQCSTAEACDCGSGSCFPGIRPRPGPGNHTCGLSLENPITRTTTRGNLVEDIIVVQSSETGSIATVHHFLFYCAPTFLLKGLASGAKGILGLGRTRISLPSQLAMAYGFDRKFAICLSSSDGVIFSGDGPYISLAGTDVSKSLMYTPLITNQGEYRINVKSIKINGKRLSVDQGGGDGETEISTNVPYTTMESSIYETFTKAYIKVATSMNMTRVASVAPFGVCFSSKNLDSTRVGPAVPIIDLVLQSEMVKWRIYGRNSMVRVSDEVMCLGFLDGGLNPRTSIVIGGYQLEDNLLQFDLGTSMLGFSSSLLVGQITCSNFEFNSMHKESL